MTSYVVHLVGTEIIQHPFKHFAHRGDANAFAASAVQSGTADMAEIYSVAETEPRAAIEVVKTGAAELVDIKSPHAHYSHRETPPPVPPPEPLPRLAKKAEEWLSEAIDKLPKIARKWSGGE